MDYAPQEPPRRGGTSDVRDKFGLAARVAGEVGFSHPRTAGAGVNLSVALYYLPSATDPLNASEQAIDTYNAVFI